jgi:hypothetical protein
MYRLLKTSFRRIWLQLYWTGIKNALALNRRNEVRPDGLVLKESSNRLEISWEARGIHPWDHDQPSPDNYAAFVEQTLEDTEAVVLRIFERLPEVDVLELKVVAPQSGVLLAEGSVPRSTLRSENARLRSVRMRLGAMGIRYYLDHQWSQPPNMIS